VTVNPPFTIRTYDAAISARSHENGDGRLSGVNVLAELLAEADFVNLRQQASLYEALFWRPYLGMTAYSFYLSLRAFAQGQAAGIWSVVTVEMLARSMGQGDRTAVLGRKASKGRPAMIGAAEVLDNLDIAIHRQRRKGTRTQHSFEVVLQLPVLTPAQTAGFDRPLAEQHEWFLGSIRGVDLVAWRDLAQESFVKEAARLFGRVTVGNP
jgi:hypothetical protein